MAHVKNELGSSFTQGDPDVEASVGKWWEEFHTLPEEQKPFDTSVYVYTSEEQELLDKALEIYRERQV